MRSLGERQFHVLMAFLVVGSLFLERVPNWKSPKVGLETFAIGLVWIALFAAHRIQNLGLQLKVLEDRVERLQRRTDAYEDDGRRRRMLPPG